MTLLHAEVGATNPLPPPVQTSNLAQMARYESELPSGTNRDAVAIYSTHIRLEHFCSSSKFMADQVGLICRQLSALIGSFTKSISWPVAHFR